MLFWCYSFSAHLQIGIRYEFSERVTIVMGRFDQVTPPHQVWFFIPGNMQFRGDVQNA